MTLIDRTGPVVPPGFSFGQVPPSLLKRRQRLGVRCRRHGLLMRDPRLGHMERRRQRKDRFAVLDSRHAASGEALSVTDAINFVDDWSSRIPGPQEVCVQRMHKQRARNGAPRSNEGLTSNQSSECPQAFLIGLVTTKDRRLDFFEIKDKEEIGERVGPGDSRALGSCSHGLDPPMGQRRVLARHKENERRLNSERPSTDEGEVHAAATVESSLLKLSPGRLLAFLKTESGRKTLRYAAVSAIAIVLSQIMIAITYGGFHTTKTVAQTAAAVFSTIPSYILNRRWVWARVGKSSASREILPFWIISLVQFAISLVAVNWLGSWMERHVDSHLLRTICLQLIVLFIYGVMWVGKFVFFNKVLFADRSAPAVSG